MSSSIPDYISFGVEIEITFPPSLNPQLLLQNTNWKIHVDQSIECNRGEQCKTVEFVSPILYGENGLANVKNFINKCKSNGASVNDSTGLHVHVGLNKDDYKLEDLKRVCHNFIKYEKSIDLIMHPSRLKNNFCKSNRELLPEENFEAKTLIYECQSIDQLKRLMCTDRYHKLNLFALDKFGTIELRQHRSSLEANEIDAWLRLVIWFVSNSIICPRSFAFLDSRTCEFGFEALFHYVVHDGELRKYFMNKKKALFSAGLNGCKCKK